MKMTTRIVDIQMPPRLGDDGLRAAREIRTIRPAIAVLVLSQFLEDGYAVDLLGDRPEGVGYLLKDRVSDVGTFAEAVRRVARGGSVIDAEVVRGLVGRRRTHDPVEELTSRAATRSIVPDLRTLPSSTYATPRALAISATGIFLPLK